VTSAASVISAPLLTLLGGAIDYAGLFPPAGLELQQALENYLSYRGSPDGWALGRFVLPAARLGELASLLPDATGGGNGSRLPLAALLGPAPAAELVAIEQFNRRWQDFGVVVESVEAKGPPGKLPPYPIRYLEVPLTGELEPLLADLVAAGGYAKIRTGGVTAEAFPQPDQLSGFLLAAARRRLPFKATAGLHHPLRGVFPFTYDGGSPRGAMYGFLNLALAAALAWQGATAAELRDALLEDRADAIRLDDTALSWRGRRFEPAELRELRQRFFHSFGSCSFREPIAELKAGGWA